MFSRGIYLVNLSTNERLPIMMVPSKLSVDSTPSLKPIASIGRNNPFYHLTGGEKKISFDVSWYSVSSDRQDVLAACKTLEAWSLSDGDQGGSPEIRLVWGGLFRDSIWKIESAPYELDLFHRKHEMFPTLAYQKITLVQISATNTNHDYIRSVRT